MADNSNQRPMPSLFAQRYTPPFSHELPSLVAETFKNESWRKKISKNSKLLKNWVWLKLNRQSHLLRDRIPPPPAKILWLHYSSASIGDSIMEVSGRALLGDYQVDLFTNKQYAELFHKDRFFGTVFTNPSEVNVAMYDFVLLDIFNTRSIQLKRRLCPSLPFACMQGFFYGANFNRMLFNCFRIHHLLGYPHKESELGQFLRPRLFVDSDPAILPAKLSAKRFAIMLGGLKEIKTYRYWPEMLQALHEKWPNDQQFPEFTLIGSQNGREFVRPVMAALDQCKTVSISKVGALTLRQTVRALAECDFFVGTDGALMHCANSLDMPGVTVFGKFLPKLYLPPKSKMQAIHDPVNVNNVEPAMVAEAVLKHSWMSGRERLASGH